MKALVRSTGIAVLALLLATAVSAQSLRGSRSSVNRQYRMARQHDFTFLSSV
ncbi:MAG: hypothetical protein GWM90_22230, partial [Gemmatimonadetes bacterium]|nr:hypothetical protein [Gemmatimonadota bacterium]NIQ57325.1 hypothetical protein [Gemmatimonadota bacterium]NIU77483.1 hypothetical protein [Gammaproteobacteria bacterium]NIX46702.1 hypothetical protein [Gemmatimonadota bacterium]NIY11051.1 hypothetical protein [Gemmatimonadota bacterium]